MNVSHHRGFSLLELVVVLAVFAVLAALSVPVFERLRGNSLERVAQSTLETIDRNGEAIGASGADVSDAQIAAAVLGELDVPEGMTVTRDDATLTVTATAGSLVASGTVTFSGGVGTIVDVAALPAESGPSSATTLPTPTTGLYNVGDVGPAGGIVFYVDPAGFACGPSRGDTCTYLEAAHASAETEITWSATENQSSEVPGADDVAVGSGYKNSLAVYDQTGNTLIDSAAAHALAHTANGFDDWFLPSKHELGHLYEQRDLVGGFLPASYWSSSEYNSYDAWSRQFVAGYYSYDSKASVSGFRVRPIRAG